MISKRYTIPYTVMMQNVDDETLLFDSQNGLFFALNESGAKMWEVMERYEEFSAVVSELLELFEVERQRLENDLEIFAQSLMEQGLLEVSDA